jgi:hypothetical protein
LLRKNLETGPMSEIGLPPSSTVHKYSIVNPAYWQARLILNFAVFKASTATRWRPAGKAARLPVAGFAAATQ